MNLLRRIDYWLHHRKRAAELAEEMEFHRQMTGTMGNMTLAREDARAVWIWPWLESVLQDLRYAFRNLRRQPGFASVAILTLGAAIGLNTSLFTVFNAVALRPWPVRDPGRMVNIGRVDRRESFGGFSLAEARYLAGHSRTFSGMIAMRNGGSVRLNDGQAASAWVSASYFDVLGVGMQQGRGFRAAEDLVESPDPVVVLSYAFWQDRMGADPRAVGKQIRVEDVPFTIVGVAGSSFTGTTPEIIDVYIPLSAAQLIRPRDAWLKELLRRPQDCCSSLAGRLAPGVSRAQARAELAVLSDQFQKQSGLEPHGVQLAGTEFIGGAPKGQVVPVLILMFLGMTLVLLLACANVGNLLLARAAARSREIGVRLSLGASRARVIRQLLTESLVLAIGAGASGVALAFRLPSWVFHYFVSEQLSFHLQPDATVLGFAMTLSVAACMMFGLAPALHGTQTQRRSSRVPLRSVLLAAQVAMSVILLAGAGLFTRGVQKAGTMDPGFTITGVSIASFDLPAGSYDAARSQAFFGQLTRDLRNTQVGLARLAPLGNAHSNTSLRMPGEDPGNNRLVAGYHVNAGYFDVLGIPVVAGRNFENADEGRQVVLVNETLARRYFKDSTAVGKTIVSGSPMTIVGVVKDAFTISLDHIEPTLYFPIHGDFIPVALFRAAPGASEAIVETAKQIDPRARVTFAPLSDNLANWLKASRAGAAIAEVLGVFALALAVVGMFGVFAYWVEQRTKEIGIRMALGARPAQVIGLVLASSSRSVAIGVMIGFAGALGISRLLARYLFGLSPFDPLAYLGVAVLLAAAGLAATYVPARRAARIDPMSALRVE